MLDNVREWVSDNLRYILLGLAVVLVLIIGFCVFRLITGSSGKSKSSTAETKPAVTNNSIVAEEMTEASQAEAASQQPSANVPVSSELVKNDAAVLTVVNRYYNACAQKDTDTLSAIVKPWDTEVESKILQNDVVESYQNIETYSKPGLSTGSYVVFAYFDGKVHDYTTLVPSLARLYLESDETGTLVVRSGWDTDAAISDYVNTVTTESDVQELITTVNDKYESALASDSALRDFLNGMSGGSGSTGEENKQEETDASMPEEMTAEVDMNIRQAPSTEAGIAGSLPVGEIVTVIAEADDGWVQIEYDSGWGVIEGYVRLEYLSGGSSSQDTTSDDMSGTGEDTGMESYDNTQSNDAGYGSDTSDAGYTDADDTSQADYTGADTAGNQAA